MYVNSFLATLNTRRVTRGRGTDAETNTMPTFLMVGKLTKHENAGEQVHVYPPSSSARGGGAPRSKADMLRSQQSALEVEIEQEVTITRDSVSACHVLVGCGPGVERAADARSIGDLQFDEHEYKKAGYV